MPITVKMTTEVNEKQASLALSQSHTHRQTDNTDKVESLLHASKIHRHCDCRLMAASYLCSDCDDSDHRRDDGSDHRLVLTGHCPIHRGHSVFVGQNPGFAHSQCRGVCCRNQCSIVRHVSVCLTAMLRVRRLLYFLWLWYGCVRGHDLLLSPTLSLSHVPPLDTSLFLARAPSHPPDTPLIVMIIN